MRPILVFLVLSAVGCSSYDVCGPSTCDGCCTASGECVSGDLNQACGTGGNTCNACPSEAPTCQQHVCRAAPVGGQDAGPDAGHAADAGADAGLDAGQLVAFHLNYQRDEVDAGSCPITHEVTWCMEKLTLPEGRLTELQQLYAECTFHGSMDAGYYLDCTNCEAQKPARCTLPDGGADGHSVRDCTFPPYTVADFCAWQLP